MYVCPPLGLLFVVLRWVVKWLGGLVKNILEQKVNMRIVIVSVHVVYLLVLYIFICAMCVFALVCAVVATMTPPRPCAPSTWWEGGRGEGERGGEGHFLSERPMASLGKSELEHSGVCGTVVVRKRDRETSREPNHVWSVGHSGVMCVAPLVADGLRNCVIFGQHVSADFPGPLYFFKKKKNLF